MQRLAIVLGLAIVFSCPIGSARADWQSMKVKWHSFWDRVHVDWHRNNAWPDPFVEVDRNSIRTTMGVQVDNGWRLQNTISTELFNPETQELTRAGELKVEWILTQMPAERRTVFVLRGRTAEITKTRLKSVEKAAATTLGDTTQAAIAVTDIIPRGGSGDYYERVNRGYDNSVPPPRLPQADGASGESGN